MQSLSRSISLLSNSSCFEDVSLRITQFAFCTANRTQFAVLFPTACDKKTFIVVLL